MAFDELVAAMDRATHDHVGGVSVVYDPEFGSAVTITGMFDENYIPAEALQSKVGTSTPAVNLRFEDLPDDPRENRPHAITIKGVSYIVRGHSTDGPQGQSIMLFLRKK